MQLLYIKTLTKFDFNFSQKEEGFSNLLIFRLLKTQLRDRNLLEEMDDFANQIPSNHLKNSMRELKVICQYYHL